MDVVVVMGERDHDVAGSGEVEARPDEQLRGARLHPLRAEVATVRAAEILVPLEPPRNRLVTTVRATLGTLVPSLREGHAVAGPAP